MNKSSASQPLRRLSYVVAIAIVLCTLNLVSESIARQDGDQENAAEQQDAARAAAIERMQTDIMEIASDKYEGRGPGTKGIDVAADYIAARFTELGLKVDSYDGTPFQHFELPAGASLGETNHATITGPGEASVELELDETFTPLALGGSAKFDMPLVFVGYGITAPDLEYDDYEGMDVRGKAVIVLQGEPQSAAEEGPFSGNRSTINAQDSRKISNAYQHGAEAVILVASGESVKTNVDRYGRLYNRALERIADANADFQKIETPTVEQVQQYKDNLDSLTDRALRTAGRMVGLDDPLVPFSTRRRGRGGSDEGRNLPVLSIKRSVADALFTAAGKASLEASETKINESLDPNSFAVEEAKISGEVTVNREIYDVKNVVGVLPATEEGPLADETVIVGAHYDHLGYGGRGSLSGGSTDIHNGADDNGSGTTGVMELARRFSQMETRRRRMVFILFSAEERGLIGSTYHANNPLFPIENTVFMLNLDMIGRLRDNQLTVRGTGTAAEFDEIFDALNETHGFEMNKDPRGEGPSDHASFYRKDIPVIDFFTNTHDDYHRPTDDPNLVNLEGMARIVDLSEDFVADVVNNEPRLTFTSEAQAEENSGNEQESTSQGTASSGQDMGDDTNTDEIRPWFGAIPSFGGQVEGVKLNGTSKGSPAEKAGLKAGDIVVELGGNRIGTLEDLDGALRKFKIGDKVRVVAMRGEERLVLEVELDVRPDDGE